MDWLVFVALSAVFAMGLSYLQKLYAESYTALETSLLSTMYALPLTIAAIPVMTDGISLTASGVTASLVSGLINVLGLLVYQRALGVGDLSVVAPFASITPLATAAAEPLLTGAGLQPLVVVSSVIVVSGAAISLSDGGVSMATFRRRDVWLAVLASCLYALAAVANSRATATMEAPVVVVIIYAVMVSGFITLLQIRGSALIKQPLTSPLHILFGVTYAALSLTLFVGYATAPSAAHVVTVRKLSVIGTVVIGVYVFGEDNLIRRLIGSGLIITGVLLLTL